MQRTSMLEHYTIFSFGTNENMRCIVTFTLSFESSGDECFRMQTIDGVLSSSMFTDDPFCCIHNGPHSYPIVIDQFIRFAAMRDFTDGEFIDFDVLRGNSTEDGIADTAVGVVIFNREDAALRCPATFHQCVSIDGGDAVEIDHTNRNAR